LYAASFLAEGISMNQYCLYLLTKNDAAYKGTNA